MAETPKELKKVIEAIENCVGLFIPIQLAKAMFKVCNDIEDYCKQLKKEE